MSASQIVPIGALCGLVLIGVINWARPKNDQTLEGVAVNRALRYEFYPDAKGCSPQGTSYLLLANSKFFEVVHETVDIEHFDSLFHRAWKIKLRGNLSHVGRFGYQGKDLRELSVLYVIDARQLDCPPTPVEQARYQEKR